MFPVTITLHNAGQLNAVLAALGAAVAAPEVPATTEVVGTKQKPSAAVSASEKAVVLTKTQTDAMDDTAGLGNAQPAATPAPTEPTASAAQADAPAPKAVTYAELQAAVLRLHKADSTAAKPIAEAMGFANFKAMPEDKWPEALAKVQEALNEKGVA